MKIFFITIITISLTLNPLMVTGQTTSTFKPNSGSDLLKKYAGVNFGDSAGAILSCLDVGGKVMNLFDSLLNKKKDKEGGSKTGGILGGAISETVPVTDAEAQKKIEAANKKDKCLDAVAYALAKQALSQVTNKTLNWVNTGFGGNPFYVRDIDSFLTSIKNEKVRDYIRIADNINKGNGDAVGASVTSKIIEMITGRPSSVSTPTTQSELKYDAFTKDFSSGGWDAWYRMTQLGENPIGAILSTSQQLGKNIEEQQQSTKNEIANGNGFLSQKLCVEYAQISPDDSSEFNSQITNPDGSPKCLRYETVTPGSVIAAQTQTITNSGTRQLEAADELNEVLGAFFDSLLNKLFNKGLQTLGRDSGDSYGNQLSGFGGNGSNIVIGSNGQPINGTGSGVVLPYNQSGDDFDPSNFNISNPRHIAAIIKTQKTFLSRALDSQASLQKIVPNLGHLDYCLPGPHPSWVSDTDQGAGSLFTSIQSSGVANPITGLFEIQPYDLFDPLRNSTQLFSGKTLTIQNDLFASGAEIAELLRNWFSSYKTTVGATFSQSALSDAFANTESTSAGQLFARGFVTDAITETSLLPNYISSIIETDSQYEVAIPETRTAITELELIRAEVLSIVTTARTRHISTKQAQGITVNMSCLNEAYDISNAPITAPAREEADATAELDTLEAAQTSFYNNL